MGEESDLIGFNRITFSLSLSLSQGWVPPTKHSPEADWLPAGGDVLPAMALSQQVALPAGQTAGPD